MAATSIHFEAVKPGSERHNKREKTLDYVFPELTPNNEYWQCDTQAARRQRCEEDVKAKTGRKMQAKAKPIQEAVVVIDERTTMADLQKLAARFKERFNIEVFQIAIHRDEGYKHGKDGKLNLHAHLVADWINHETGKSARLSPKDMSEMQTITAEILGMERGVSSERKHLDAIAFKIQAEQQHIEKLEEELQELTLQIDNLSTTKILKAEAKEAILSVFGAAKRQKTIKDQEKQLEALRKAKNRLSDENKALREKIDNLQQNIKKIVKTGQSNEQQLREAQRDNRALSKKVDELTRELHPDRYATEDIVDGRKVENLQFITKRDGSRHMTAIVDGRPVSTPIELTKETYDLRRRHESHTLDGADRQKAIRQYLLPHVSNEQRENWTPSRGMRR